jgi:hypothetical protein
VPEFGPVMSHARKVFVSSALQAMTPPCEVVGASKSNPPRTDLMTSEREPGLVAFGSRAFQYG